MTQQSVVTDLIKEPTVATAAQLSPAERRGMLAALAASLDNPLGYACFYEVIFERSLPEHAMAWIVEAYNDFANGVYSLDEAFRGSTKTTTLTIAFAAFRIGHQPDRSNLLIQVGDDIADDNTSAIADIIANNPGWQLVFPNVVPDRDMGWGAGGYEVKRTDLPYGEWRGLNAGRKDPTLVGVGYKSREIIGKHPTGLLIVDDIHDENNTASERELANVLKILQGTIFPTIIHGQTWVIFVGTPWTKNDTLAYAESTGRFSVHKTPVYTVVNDSAQGDAGAIFYNNQWVRLAWPEYFTISAVNALRSLGRTEFARMYLLDLSATANQVFRYFSFPHDRINTAAWLGGGGCDYASTSAAFIDKTGKRDYFALFYGFAVPGGGLVVFDGLAEHLTQAEAEQRVETAQNIFPNWRGTCVEGDGKGEEFINLLYRKPHLRILPLKTGGKGKDRRLVRQLGPWLESGRLRISDAQTPGLNRLRQQLDDYPNVDHDDCLDAVYWLCRMFPDVLYVSPNEEGLPQAQAHRRRQPNPFAGLNNV